MEVKEVGHDLHFLDGLTAGHTLHLAVLSCTHMSCFKVKINQKSFHCPDWDWNPIHMRNNLICLLFCCHFSSSWKRKASIILTGNIHRLHCAGCKYIKSNWISFGKAKASLKGCRVLPHVESKKKNCCGGSAKSQSSGVSQAKPYPMMEYDSESDREIDGKRVCVDEKGLVNSKCKPSMTSFHPGSVPGAWEMAFPNSTPGSPHLWSNLVMQDYSGDIPGLCSNFIKFNLNHADCIPR